MKIDVIKNVKKIVLMLIVVFCIFYMLFSNKVNAANMEEDLNNIINSTSANIENIDDISNEEILNIYDEITDKYTNEEIADIILDNKEQISSEVGISEGVVEAGAEFVRNTSKEAIRDIISDEKNIDKIKESLKQGASAGDAVASIVEDTTIMEKIELFVKILLANNIINTIFWVLIILFIYCTITRCVIYKKAGKNWLAGIIPFYRQITMYKICGLSPFLMLLWLVPILGWIIMFIIGIMKRILLAENFGRGGLFGLGILILPPLFYTILAFNPNIEYEKE